jgi:hypothetical protein
VIVSALILVSIFSALNGLVLTTPRMYYAMARERVFFERLASVHPRFGNAGVRDHHADGVGRRSSRERHVQASC